MKVGRIILVLCICLLLALPVFAFEQELGSLSVTPMDQEKTVAGGSVTLYRLEDSAGDDAQALAEYAKRHLHGDTRDVEVSGTVLYEDLEPGLYLAVQQESAVGYKKFLPFLVRIPMEIDGELFYDIPACPKVSRIEQSSLPQTGQLRWPVPVLAVLGVGLFGIGFYNRKKR